MPPTLLLDLDGTLIDSVPDLLSALNRMGKPRGFTLFDRAEITPMIGDGARILLERAFAARGAPFDEAALAPYLADYTANSAVETKPFPGVIETLQIFADKGWRIAVCTNKPAEPTHAVLAALGLAPFLAAIGGGDSFPTRKPDPGHLLGTLALAGGSVDAAVMVGDHLNDVLAAKGAGVPCLFAAWGYGSRSMAESAAAIASHFSDLPAMAEALL
ncbi:MAG: gph [Rhodospirillales bacterium]|nr:gph [Rhodospirillales bacterium]